jgi:arylsulfatase
VVLSSLIYPFETKSEVPKKDNAQKPNILLILADDMGFSDIGCYGGEINTPNLDLLAKEGVRYTQFYNAARCCPTRASLLTGVYPHQAGMGWMTNADLGTPQYRGDLSKNVVTIAELLKTAGYNTYMTGKWHLSSTRKDQAGINDNWPAQRGFDHFFGIVGGAGNYFHLPVFSNNQKYPSPKDFYLTNAISDSSVTFIEQNFKMKDRKPMFMYVAYTSPHWPLHALAGDIKKYEGVYDIGWDKVRENRLKKQYELGIWNKNIDLSGRDIKVPSWDSISPEKKKDFARRMSIYAAQIDAMDQGIGRIIKKLKETGQFDNTVIFFLSDNGGCAEFISSGKSRDLNDNLANTFESYRINWANASNTPYREYKHWIHEGGIHTPLIVHWPNGIDKSMNNSFIRDYGHITDIMATCAALSSANYPKQYKGKEIVPMQGTSLLPHFSKKPNNRGPIFWEHEANIGMREGKWKLVAKTPEDGTFDENKLELYNIDEDPTELKDLAHVYPQKLDSMYRVWKSWANYVQVYPFDTREYNVRTKASK